MTARSELTFGEVAHEDSDQNGLREWALRGPDGAVNFLAAGTMGLAIGTHRAAPDNGDSPPARPCDLLDGGRCQGDVTFLGAAELAARLTETPAGGDGEAVIRAELEAWYASHLAPGGELS